MIVTFLWYKEGEERNFYTIEVSLENLWACQTVKN